MSRHHTRGSRYLDPRGDSYDAVPSATISTSTSHHRHRPSGRVRESLDEGSHHRHTSQSINYSVPSTDDVPRSAHRRFSYPNRSRDRGDSRYRGSWDARGGREDGRSSHGHLHSESSRVRSGSRASRSRHSFQVAHRCSDAEHRRDLTQRRGSSKYDSSPVRNGRTNKYAARSDGGARSSRRSSSRACKPWGASALSRHTAANTVSVRETVSSVLPSSGVWDCFEAYESPTRQSRNHRSRRVSTSLDASSPSGTRMYTFRVRVKRCRGVFPELRASVPPDVYMVLHTTMERGQTGVARRQLHPMFNDEFLFELSTPESDSLFCTLVAISSKDAKALKVSECELSLSHLLRGEEREVWVPLVRFAGTSRAHECGKVLIGIYSKDYGEDQLLSEAEEAHFYDAVHSVLRKNAPHELHRLDWLVGEYSPLGRRGLEQIRSMYPPHNVKPVRVRLTVKEVFDLALADGAPTRVESCYVEVSTSEMDVQTSVVPYHRRASFKEDFQVILFNPGVDTICLSVYSAGRKLGEVLTGLTNVVADTKKELTLMLVSAADTGDATNCGQITVALRTEGYSSPYQMSCEREQHTRERVLAYLWTTLRDDLHRLDPIVASIDDVDSYMREWARAIGPEPVPRHLCLTIQRGADLVVKGKGTEKGLDQFNSYYVRVRVGPAMLRTSCARVDTEGNAVFSSSMDIVLYEPQSDAIELILIHEADGKDIEVSRAVVGAPLPRGEKATRSVQLVASAQSPKAHVQGELVVEMLAIDFDNAGVPLDGEREEYLLGRLQSLLVRHSPSTLHRAQYMLDTHVGGEAAFVESIARQYGPDVAAAPMTVRVMGIKEFTLGCSCYVKVYMNGKAIMRTDDRDDGTTVRFSIEDNNETTLTLSDAQNTSLSFKVGQHRTLQRTRVIARVEVSLAHMLRGEKNELWIPLFSDAAESTVGWGASATANGAGSSGSPLGHLGIELQSMAFTNTTVTVYRGVTGDPHISAREAVIHDVSTLMAKFNPKDLPRVQPCVDGCTSLKTAHEELRAQLAPLPIGFTLYVNVDSVELAMADGTMQTAHGGVGVRVTYGGECQQSVMCKVYAKDDINQRLYFPTIRLDVPDLSTTNVVAALRRKDVVRPEADPLTITVFGTGTDPCAFDDAQGRQANMKWRVSGENSLDAYIAPMDTSNTGADEGDNGKKHKPESYVTPDRGDVGEIRLSLRALVTAPLHKFGDVITVPIVHRTAMSPFGLTGKENEDTIKKTLVGRISFHLTIPAFEEVPHWLRLASRGITERIYLPYILYYVRRLSAYLSQYNPVELFDFYYILYERDVALGRWPISLHDWMNALLKRFGPEKEIFGLAPLLPFDPEEDELRRLRDEKLFLIREGAFTESDEDVTASEDGPKKHLRPSSSFVVAVPSPPKEEEEPKTEAARHYGARSTRSSRSYSRLR